MVRRTLRALVLLAVFIVLALVVVSEAPAQLIEIRRGRTLIRVFSETRPLYASPYGNGCNGGAPGAFAYGAPPSPFGSPYGGNGCSGGYAAPPAYGPPQLYGSPGNGANNFNVYAPQGRSGGILGLRGGL